MIGPIATARRLDLGSRHFRFEAPAAGGGRRATSGCCGRGRCGRAGWASPSARPSVVRSCPGRLIASDRGEHADHEHDRHPDRDAATRSLKPSAFHRRESMAERRPARAGRVGRPLVESGEDDGARRRSERIPVFDVRLDGGPRRGGRGDPALGLVDDGAADRGVRERVRARTSGVEHAVAMSSCTAALHLAYLAAGIGPGRRGHRPRHHLRRLRRRGPLLRRHPGAGGGRRARTTSASTPRTSRRGSPPRTKAVCAVHYGGYAAPLEALAELCERHGPGADRGRRPQPRRDPPGLRAQARHPRPRRDLQLLLQQDPLLRRGRAAGDRRRAASPSSRGASARTR